MPPAAALLRSIPAWAGETLRINAPAPTVKVYPRVGGGNVMVRSLGFSAAGLSPRGRGKPAQGQQAGQGKRSIPAWAGETLPGLRWHPHLAVYPRVGGGNLPA